jgi:tetratricopeptide (TPR) repeat protein
MNISEQFELAVEHYQKENFQEAENICKKILEVDSQNIDAIRLLSMLYYQLKKYDLAVTFLQKALKCEPNDFYTLFLLGNVFLDLGNLDEAAMYFQNSIELNPSFADAHYNIAFIFEKTDQYEKALSSYRQALSLNPDSADVYNNLGNLLLKLKRFDDAVLNFKKALELNPDYILALNNLGITLKEKRLYEDAIIYLKKAIEIDPSFADAYYNLAIVLKGKNQIAEAIAFFHKTIELNPSFPDAYYDLAIVLKDDNQIDEAVTFLQKAIYLNPFFSDAYNNIALICDDKGQTEEAIAYYQKALRIKPDDAEIHWNMSQTLLSSGNFEQGWREYEWRTEVKDFKQDIFPQFRWDGRPLEGKSLIITTEQGIGDEIMFASCLHEIIAQAGLCIIECDKRLIPLFSRSFAKSKMIARLSIGAPYPEDLPLAEMKISIGSLPKFLRPNLSSFLQQSAFLIPDYQKVELWRKRFSNLGEGLKIGISWRGGSKPAVKLARSTVLEQWKELLSVPEVHFINLQYGDCTNELREARENLGITIHEWEDADPLKDLDAFAAQISALDLVISVDNATVHMAGALGVPAWVLLPFSCDWRWMHDFEDTPWYKTIRLIRQSNSGEWDTVFERTLSDLRQYISTKVMPEIKYSYKGSIATEVKVQQPFPPLPSDKTYRCAVIIPVGPGHETLCHECLSSIDKSFANTKGRFSEIITIRIDDPEGRLGRSRARNLGIRKAAEHNVDWIFFIDADDLMSLSAFEYVSPYLDAYDGIWGSIWPIEKGESTAKERPHQLPFLYSIEDILSYDPFVTLGIGHFVKTSVALSILFDESLDAGEDFDYYLRVWEKYNCIKIPLPLWFHRRGEHSQGPKSATGIDWRQQVEKIIKQKRESLNQKNTILQVSIDEKIKLTYKTSNWDRIEQEKQKLLSFCKPISPVSFIRLGDGELLILKERDQLANLLVDVIKHADLLGLPDHYDRNVRSHILDWDRQLSEYLLNFYTFKVNENKIISSYIFLYIPEIIGEVIKNKRVLWITANSGKIVDNLKNERFRSYYNLHDIINNSFIEIPESNGPLPHADCFQVLLHVEKCLSKQQDYDIALIGGGVLGKIYCHIIKSKYRKQAIDIGCLMSAYKGLRNRVVFRHAGDLDFLVWQG